MYALHASVVPPFPVSAFAAIMRLATAGQLLFIYLFSFDFSLICANIKDFSRLVIAEVRIRLVLVLTFFPHLGASEQLVLLVQGLNQMCRTTFHFILNCSSLHAALGK